MDPGRRIFQRAVGEGPPPRKCDAAPPYDQRKGTLPRGPRPVGPQHLGRGLGRSVTEAQINGIPVLASSLGGLPESVGPGGILVDPSAGSEAWVSALSELWDDAGNYEKYSVVAEKYAQRDEVQTAHIIGEFIRRADETIASTGR